MSYYDDFYLIVMYFTPLRDFKAMGVTGTGPVIMRALESWVTDIYSNQMHQVHYSLKLIVS